MRTTLAVRLAGLALLVVASGAPVAAQTTWSVDAAGGGDFLTLAGAVSSPSVMDGDTLLVEPGTYGSFVTGKALTIVGRPGTNPPFVDGESRIDGAAKATLAGLVINELLCRQIPGRLTIEDCDIGHSLIGSVGIAQDTFLLEDCAEVVVSNGKLQGKTGDLNNLESAGVRIANSRVALVSCAIFGGQGGDGDYLGWPGQPGVDVMEGSQVVVAGCAITGGSGGNGDFGLCQSQAGEGIKVNDSTMWVFGDLSDVISGGHHCPQGKAFAISGLYSHLTVSGVWLSDPPISPAVPLYGTLELPEIAQPFLFVGGDPAPGSIRRLNVQGPVGAPAMVFISLQPFFANTPKIRNGPLWIDPAATLFIVPFVLSGQEVPVTMNLPLPREPALAGFDAWFQGFIPAGGGQYLATNPASIVLRF